MCIRDSVYLIREALREHGVEHPIRVVPDGEEVLRMISPLDPAGEDLYLVLIILDFNLPKHDGIEILERLRERGWKFYTFIGGAARIMFAWDSDLKRVDALLRDLEECASSAASHKGKETESVAK